MSEKINFIKKLIDESIQVSTTNLDFVNGKRNYTIKNKPAWSHNFNFAFTEKILYQQSYALVDQFLPRQDDFIVLKPRIEDKENWNKVNLLKRILVYFIKKYDLASALYDVIYDSLVYPFGVLKVSWSRDEKEKVYLNFEEDKVYKVKELKESIHPNFESIDPTEVYVSNKIKDLKDLEYVIHKRTKNISELIEKMPEFTELFKKYLSTNEEDKEVEVIEYYTVNEYTLIVNNDILIDRPSLYKSNILPFFFFRFIKKPRSIAGVPLVSLIKDSIEYIEELLNFAADNTLLSVLQIYLLKAGTNVDIDNFVLQPGAVLTINSNDDFKPIFAGQANLNHLKDFNLHMSMINDLVSNVSSQQVALADTAAQAKILTYLGQRSASIYFQQNKNSAFLKMLKFVVDGIQQFLTKDDIKLITDSLKIDISEGTDINLDVDLLIDISDYTPDIQRVAEIERLNQLTQILNVVQGLPEPHKTKMLDYIFSLFNLYKDGKEGSNTGIDINVLNAISSLASKAPNVDKAIVSEETYTKVKPKQEVEKAVIEAEKEEKEA